MCIHCGKFGKQGKAKKKENKSCHPKSVSISSPNSSPEQLWTQTFICLYDLSDNEGQDPTLSAPALLLPPTPRIPWPAAQVSSLGVLWTPLGPHSPSAVSSTSRLSRSLYTSVCGLQLEANPPCLSSSPLQAPLTQGLVLALDLLLISLWHCWSGTSSSISHAMEQPQGPS